MRGQIAPSLMCVDFLNVERDITVLDRAGSDYYHIDIMDGDFVPNFALSPDFVKALRRVTKTPMDFHLMVNNPERHLEALGLMPGDIVSVHQETTRHLQKTLAAIRALGAQASVALNPATPLSTIEEVLPDLDMLLILCVNPGFAGQKLIEGCIGKIARARKWLDAMGYPRLPIEADGNVSIVNARRMRDAGASVFVAGTSAVFRPEGIEKGMAALREAIA